MKPRPPASWQKPPTPAVAEVAALLLVVAAALAPAFGAAPSSLSDQTLIEIQFDQQLDAQITTGLSFTNEHGQAARLGEYFGQRPVILVLGYYECPMLCTLVLNGLVAGLQELKQDAGTDFDVVMVSIDPTETPALARAKQRTYLKRYGRPGAERGWHFLTGNEATIGRLADEVGFHFAYDPVIEQYAHPSGIVVLTPQGKVSQYLFGVNFPAKELNAALQAAAASRVGSPIQQIIFLCFHYNPLRGKYGRLVMTILRLGAVLTLVAIGVFLAGKGRRHRPTNPSAQVAVPGQPNPLPAANLPEAGKEAGP